MCEGKINRKVYLSYSFKDKRIADNITYSLMKEDIRCSDDIFEIDSENQFQKTVKDVISACSYLIILLSPNSIKSRWIQYELNFALTRDLKARDITILPVLIEDCDIPSFLKEYQIFDLRNQNNIDGLIEQIRTVSKINFSNLSYKQFEDLVEEMLNKFEFINIEREWIYNGNEIDIKANYLRKDPLGEEIEETWIVEVKFYNNSRVDIKTLKQLITILSSFKEPVMGLLVTNSQLTSVVQEWIKSKKLNNRIRIIDGPKLKRYLLKYNDIIEKYFNGSGQNEYSK
ncbi:TIR domain-containing protein [Clostridium cadaveris]|uniref:TIR domain-containing protein n=1 Tax=Clostridium cadaveris TaxID=1529 RepID=UPI0015B4D203|nr:TIR domain-containing protein [Clostridium cadaveris]NWK10757.1 TIR domain-containing protein [Clostridium cadaveris]